MVKLIAIRIRGTVDVPKKIKHTLNLLKLRKKFVAVLLEKNERNLGMLKKAEGYIAYGEINAETLRALLLKRARRPGNKPIEIAGKTIDEFIKNFMDNHSELKDLGIKPFFRLHPPRGGFKKSIRLPYPKGVLGYQGEKINKLVNKML